MTPGGATMTPVSIVIQVQPTDPNAPPTPTRTLRPTFTSTPTPTPSATFTPAPTPTPTNTPPPVAFIPTPTPTIFVLPPTPTPAEPALAYPGHLISGRILLDVPEPEVVLPIEQEFLRFKWVWDGPELRPCELIDGFAFEIRIWPHPELNRDNLSEEDRIMLGIDAEPVPPLGIVDAVQARPIIQQSCNPEIDIRFFDFLLTNLKSTPGVRQANIVDTGQFYWDVAYVQTEPFYEVLEVSGPRPFWITVPPEERQPPTPTPLPTPLGGARCDLLPQPITLLAPTYGTTIGSNVNTIEFRWRWGQGTCELPPPSCAFEVRFWPADKAEFDFSYPALGLFDAYIEQANVDCNPLTCECSYLAEELKKRPGPKVRFQEVIDSGESIWDGRFLWDVALVQLDPDYQIIRSSEAHTLEWTLEYGGPLDPTGAPLSCSDVPSWLEAQAIYLISLTETKMDLHGFDDDGNNIACEDLLANAVR